MLNRHVQRLPPSPAPVPLGVTALPLGTPDEGILEAAVKYQSCQSTAQLLAPSIPAG